MPYTNWDCEDIEYACEDCIDEYCNMCAKEHCKNQCDKADLPIQACSSCDLRDEQDCEKCDLKEKLNCLKCKTVIDICLNCDNNICNRRIAGYE